MALVVRKVAEHQSPGGAAVERLGYIVGRVWDVVPLEVWCCLGFVLVVFICVAWSAVIGRPWAMKRGR